MQEILRHPAAPDLAFLLLGIGPWLLALRRTGLSRHWAWLWALQLLLPGLGLAAMAGVFCHQSWPKLPAPPRRWVKTRIWGQAA